MLQIRSVKRKKQSSLENFCAILIVISPFVFVFGNDYLKDYLFYVGIVSGITMVFIPALTTFVISNMLGGGKVNLIGNIIEQEFTEIGRAHV